MLTRRDFIKTAAVIGAGSSMKPVNAMSIFGKNSAGRFDVHPFVKEHPEAVFIAKTNIASKGDADSIRSAGFKLSKELIVKTSSGGHPNSTINISIRAFWRSGMSSGQSSLINISSKKS